MTGQLTLPFSSKYLKYTIIYIIKIQNIQGTNKFNRKKSELKMCRGPEQTFFQRRISGQQVHEKMLNITNHQINTNQNHTALSPYTCQNGYHQKDNE